MAQKMILVSCADGRITDDATRVRECATAHGFDIGEHAVYRIKIPGPDGTVCGVRGQSHVAALREDIALLVEKAAAALIAVAGHTDCAGYPVNDEQHAQDTMEAARKIREWQPEKPVLVLLDEKQEDGSWVYRELGYLEA